MRSQLTARGTNYKGNPKAADKNVGPMPFLVEAPLPLFFPPLGFKTLCLACLTYCTPKFITHHDYSISQSQLGKFLSRHATRKETLPSWIQITHFVGTSGLRRCQFLFFSILTALSEKNISFFTDHWRQSRHYSLQDTAPLSSAKLRPCALSLV